MSKGGVKGKSGPRVAEIPPSEEIVFCVFEHQMFKSGPRVI